MPHGHCFLWRKDLLILHVGSDIITGICYFIIPILLLIVVNRHFKKVPFQKIILLFGGFIIACGAVHFLAAYTIWIPDYWTFGIAKLMMAIFSVLTTIVLTPTIKKALVQPNPYIIELKRMNDELIQKISEKENIEKELKDRANKLEELNKVMVGREIKMAELKKEIESLRKKASKP